ncbi:MAG: hypothetical protein AAF710_00145 [Planctomycetota bacterium]
MASKARKRKRRRELGRQTFTAEEIHAITEQADNPHLRAMILLGINSG